VENTDIAPLEFPAPATYNTSQMRIMYSVFIVILILVILPLMLAVSLVIAVFSGFPIIYRQLRIGKDGQSFTLYKFRTMIHGAEQLKSKYKKLNIAAGPAFKIPDDPRYTRIGKVLSHIGLDELPQLFNVLKGDMGLIGPRPLPADEVRHLTPWQQKRHRIKPGIISPWVLNGYHANSFDEWMRSDIAYIDKKSPWFDMRLTLRTVKFLCRLLVTEINRGLGMRR
jgi:lipopolysaccharide/colanic/teichoic acid biosynthesis glycosyltransferase